MGDAPPKWSDPLHTWVKPGHDIYAITTQECQYTPRGGYVTCEEDFFGWIADHLGDGYMKLACTSLMSIRLGVFVRRELYPLITDVKYATVATGIANMYDTMYSTYFLALVTKVVVVYPLKFMIHLFVL